MTGPPPPANSRPRHQRLRRARRPAAFLLALGLIGATGLAGAGPAHAVSPPIVTRIAPLAGPGTGGTVVNIYGKYLGGASAVHFGEAAATSLTVKSSWWDKAVSPPGRGTVDVTVTTEAGTSANDASDRFTYLPAVTAVSPNKGGVAGGTTVTLTGVDFTGASAVEFGSTPAPSFTVNSDTSITATSPPGAIGRIHVHVHTEQGTSLASPGHDTFQYTPTITSVKPTSGPAAGGTIVKITGTGFAEGHTVITFGAALATSVSCPTSTECTAVSPRYAAGTSLAEAVRVKVYGVIAPRIEGDVFHYFVEQPGLYLRRDQGERLTEASAAWIGVVGAAELETCYTHSVGSVRASNGELELETGPILEIDGCPPNALLGVPSEVHVNPDGTAGSSGFIGIETPYGCVYEGEGMSGSLDSELPYLAVSLHGTLTLVPSETQEQLEYELYEVRSYIELLEAEERTPAIEAELEALRAYQGMLEAQLAEQPECAGSEKVQMGLAEPELEVERVG